jgi:hypothetical protein
VQDLGSRRLVARKVLSGEAGAEAGAEAVGGVGVGVGGVGPR